jgi:hypothetical protein
MNNLYTLSFNQNNTQQENSTMAKITNAYEIIAAAFVSLLRSLFSFLQKKVFTAPIALAVIDGVLWGLTFISLWALGSTLGFINLLVLFWLTFGLVFPAIYMVLYRENLCNYVNKVERGVWI